MKYYFAPMEGITGHIYRNVHHRIFPGIDKYFAPFVTPNESKKVFTKELKGLLPENNEGIPLVPQILTNNAEGFISMAKKIKSLGYEEINLNLGCPSGTVVSKNRGSGFLAFPEALDRFLDEIFMAVDMKISVKTRLGKEDPQEFYRLLDIYNKYPMTELIIHPRIRQDFYKGGPRLEYFSYGHKHSKNHVCYNGDIWTAEDADRIKAAYTPLNAMMLGRGLLTNPGIVEQIKAADKGGALGGAGHANYEKIKAFHDEIYAQYQVHLFGERPVLFKMKELWFYMIGMFPGCEREAKKIKKAEQLHAYEAAVDEIFGHADC